MKTRMKVKWLLGVIVAMGFGLVGKAQAANPDTMQVSVTPTVTYAVSITSVSAGGYNFGTVALGASTQSTAAIVLTNTGNVSEYFSLAISNTSGNWAPNVGGAGTDAFRMGAIINGGAQPAFGSFSDYLDVPPVPGTAGNLYGQSNTKTNPAATKNLWLSLEMPTALASGGTGAQTMTLTVNGQSL